MACTLGGKAPHPPSVDFNQERPVKYLRLLLEDDIFREPCDEEKNVQKHKSLKLAPSLRSFREAFAAARSGAEPATSVLPAAGSSCPLHPDHPSQAPAPAPSTEPDTSWLTSEVTRVRTRSDFLYSHEMEGFSRRIWASLFGHRKPKSKHMLLLHALGCHLLHPC